MLACKSSPCSFLLGTPSWQYGASHTHRWTSLGASAGGQVSGLPSCTLASSRCYPPSVGGLLHAWVVSRQMKCWEKKGKIRVMLCQDSLAFADSFLLYIFYSLSLPFQNSHLSIFPLLLSFCRSALAPLHGRLMSFPFLSLLWHWLVAEGQIPSSKILCPYHLTLVLSSYPLSDSATVPQVKSQTLPTCYSPPSPFFMLTPPPA